MEKLLWSTTDIRKLYRLDEKISRQTLLNAEERGDIPKAARHSRGSIQIRKWELEQLPGIGARFGFLQKPKKQQIICVYTPKGGVLKTTFGFNLARTLALNGIKTIIIGLDVVQGSITSYALPKKQIESLDELTNEYQGLYHYFIDKKPIKEIIRPTSLPTLDIIPETPELNHLEMKFRLTPRREYIFKDKIVDSLADYEVIVFDNGPGWNQLVENTLTASNCVISPMGCDIETFKALDKNLSIIFEFQEAMNIKWDNFFQMPTLLEKNKLSQQIYAAYLNNYKDYFISIPIRRNIKGQEARAFNQCVIEHEPTSPLAQDYYDAITEIWTKLNSE
jgi:chromosome partitioning protein